MHSFKNNAARACVILFAISFSFAGCGGEKTKSDTQKAEEALKSKFDENGLITANIVVRAYEQGRLGTREQVEADMEPYFSPPDYGYKIPKPFDSSGKLIPLAAMNDEQLHAFSEWCYSGKVYGVLHDEIMAAIAEAQKKREGKKD
jgi:hypothetical protein